jgi:hypothetical protein
VADGVVDGLAVLVLVLLVRVRRVLVRLHRLRLRWDSVRRRRPRVTMSSVVQAR